MEKTIIWKVEFNKKARKRLKRLSTTAQKQILDFVFEKLIYLENPRSIGSPLLGELKGFWRYRINDYRIICEIRDKELLIIVVDNANRSIVYQ